MLWAIETKKKINPIGCPQSFPTRYFLLDGKLHEIIDCDHLE